MYQITDHNGEVIVTIHRGISDTICAKWTAKHVLKAVGGRMRKMTLHPTKVKPSIFIPKPLHASSFRMSFRVIFHFDQRRESHFELARKWLALKLHGTQAIIHPTGLITYQGRLYGLGRPTDPNCWLKRRNTLALSILRLHEEGIL